MESDSDEYLGELIVKALRREDECRLALSKEAEAGHFDFSRLWEIGGQPEQAFSQSEEEHLAGCKRCQRAVTRFRREVPKIVSEQTITVRQRQLSYAFDTGSCSGAYGNATQATWRPCDAGDGPLESQVRRAVTGDLAIDVSLRRSTQPVEGGAVLLKCGATLRLMIWVPTTAGTPATVDNWITLQRFKGEHATYWAKNGAVSIVAFNVGALMAEDVPLLVDSLLHDGNAPQTVRMLRNWLSTHRNSVASETVAAALEKMVTILSPTPEHAKAANEFAAQGMSDALALLGDAQAREVLRALIEDMPADHSSIVVPPLPEAKSLQELKEVLRGIHSAATQALNGPLRLTHRPG